MAFTWLGRFIVFVLLVGSPWLYGSVSQMAQFYLLCLAISGLVAWWFAMAFGQRSSQLFPYLAFPVMLGLVLIGFQLMPLPESVAKAIAPKQLELYETYGSAVQGELFSDVDDKQMYAPRITMDADGTAKMFNLLLLSLVLLLLGCHFFNSRKSIYLLPIALTINGVLISGYGVVQRLQGIRTIFGRELTHGGIPFGPFVNRNNAAGFLLICLAGSLALLFAAFNRRAASGQRPRQIITQEYPIWRRISLHAGLFFAELNATKLLACFASFAIIFGILGTLSRGGILAMSIGLICVTIYVCVYLKSSRLLIGSLGIGFLVLGLMSFLGLGDQLAGRLGALNDAELVTSDKRLAHWIQTAPAISEFSPLGSGVGSYLNVHRLYRVDSENQVFFFAENQYFQTLVEAGFPGILLLLTAIGLLALSIRFIIQRGNSPKTASVSVMGLFVVSSQAVAAFFDFGLFIPANTCALAIVCGFLAGQAHGLADRLKKKYLFQFYLHRFMTMALLLAVFSASVVALLSCYRYYQIESAMGTNPQTESYRTLNLQDTEKRIEKLQTALSSKPDANGMTRLAELYLYQYRIRLFEALLGSNLIDAVDSQKLDNNWLSTGLDRLHNMVNQARAVEDSRRLNTLLTDPLVNENLLPAAHFLRHSRSRSPLQPSVHLLLGQVHAVGQEANSDQFHLTRSLELAPANAPTAFICGIFNLQAKRTEDACQNFQRCLQISPSFYQNVVQVAVPFLPPEKIVNEILPNDPMVLYNFSRTYLTSKSSESLKSNTYRRVIELLEEARDWDRKSLQVKADVQKELGDLQGAIATVRLSVDLHSNVLGIRYRLAHLLMADDQLDEALAVARYLRRRDRDNRSYESLESKILRLKNEKLPDQL